MKHFSVFALSCFLGVAGWVMAGEDDNYDEVGLAGYKRIGSGDAEVLMSNPHWKPWEISRKYQTWDDVVSETHFLCFFDSSDPPIFFFFPNSSLTLITFFSRILHAQNYRRRLLTLR